MLRLHRCGIATDGYGLLAAVRRALPERPVSERTPSPEPPGQKRPFLTQPPLPHRFQQLERDKNL